MIVSWKHSLDLYLKIRNFIEKDFSEPSLSISWIGSEGAFTSNCYQLIRKRVRITPHEFAKKCSDNIANDEISAVVDERGVLHIVDSGVEAKKRILSASLQVTVSTVGTCLRSNHAAMLQQLLFQKMQHKVREESLCECVHSSYDHSVLWIGDSLLSVNSIKSEAVFIPYWEKWSSVYPQTPSFPNDLCSDEQIVALGLVAALYAAEKCIFSELPVLYQTSENLPWFWSSLLKRTESYFESDSERREIFYEQKKLFSADIYDYVWPFVMMGRHETGCLEKLRQVGESLCQQLASPERELYSRDPLWLRDRVAEYCLLYSFFDSFNLSLHSSRYVL